jgi:hypothetical protein
MPSAARRIESATAARRATTDHSRRFRAESAANARWSSIVESAANGRWITEAPKRGISPSLTRNPVGPPRSAPPNG